MESFRLIQGSRDLQNEHLLGCIEWLRAQPALRKASLIFMPEIGPGSHGTEIAYAVANMGAKNTYTMSEAGTANCRQHGVPKTPIITNNMVLATRSMLKRDQIHFAQPLGTFVGGSTASMESLANDAVDRLCAQLLAFRRVETPGGQTKWTGKDGATHRDDLAVAAMMVTVWGNHFLNAKAYKSARAETAARFKNTPMIL